ncbi:TIMELESS-interacting protein [Nasonia vitripennis]|uniref:TIMELESS-interacting protein n=1 Tax=Nasonia vitripennis TaxID=7425 RepID=A0A7M7QV43_NASVI|nr:TIMELESS-interacting protein [Nasonia vitripennis]
MSDAELSDIADDDDIVRRHEREDEDDDNESGAENQDGNDSNGEVKADGDEDNAGGQRVEPPTKKKITRKMYVLNSERLKGRKGVHTIEKLYEGFKFKGKGHEKEDLDRVMKRLEYWAFRIFPKLDFDDFLAKCEHLGHKKDLQVHLKKYRMGIISADDLMDANNDIIEEEEKEDDPNIMRTESELLAQIRDNDFQRLFDETERAAEPIS